MTISAVLSAKGDRVATINPDDRVAEAIDMLAEWGIGALVVSSDKKTIEGIISERDVVRSFAKDQEWTFRLRVADIMTANVITCSPADSVDDLMTLMTENRIRHVPVTNENILVGIVSLGDIVKQRMKTLETESEALKGFISGTH
ncbi:MAG: CBS domain-containing protein [Acidimicrobiales bacterium]|jgi:CBS domain-containing protein